MQADGTGVFGTYSNENDTWLLASFTASKGKNTPLSN
jgi:hypothetical protein